MAGKAGAQGRGGRLGGWESALNWVLLGPVEGEAVVLVGAVMLFGHRHRSMVGQNWQRLEGQRTWVATSAGRMIGWRFVVTWWWFCRLPKSRR